MRNPIFNGSKIQGSFFERLDPNLPIVRSVDDSKQVAAVVSAIKRHIEWLLNSRQGNSQSAPELGLSDFNDATGGSTEFTVKIAENIKETIQHYEPRVTVQDVVFTPNPDNPSQLMFKITGQLTLQKHNKNVLIELVLNGHNKHYDVY